MKRHGQRPSGGDQRRGLRSSNLVRCSERARDNSVRPCVLRLANLLEGGSMLGLRKHEIACTRTNQHKHGNGELRAAGAERLHVRRRSAMGQIGAELNTVGATLGRRKRSVHRLDGGLDENGHKAEVTLTSQRERKTRLLSMI